MEINLVPVDDGKSTLETNPPRLLQYLKEKESEFVGNILNVARIVEPILNRIAVTFPNYTLHDIKHSMRIMEYMYSFINDIEKHSELEIAILIYSALLHDIGMYATDEEIEKIKNDKYDLSDIKYSAMLKKHKGNLNHAIQEFIRRIHSERATIFIKSLIIKEKYLADYFILPSQPATNFIEDLCLICTSHTKDFSWLERKLKSSNEKGTYTYNLLFCSLLLRLADILDIDSYRTPPALYDLINPEGLSNEEWQQHFIIHNKDKIKRNEKNHQKNIVLLGECSEANIHRKLLKYINWINEEIKNANRITETMSEKYQLQIKFPLDNKIEPKGYTISDLQLEIDFNAVTNLLMGEKIYGDKSLGLRELIQNSIDACKVRCEFEKRNRNAWDDEYVPSIKVILDPKKNQVIIKDNGTGMSLEIIKKYFLNVGLSYYRSDEFLLQNLGYIPIGNFGIGFLSCFMLSKDVLIRTRDYKDIFRYDLQLTKESQYICLNEEEDTLFEGTEIVLKYNEFMEAMDNKLDKLKEFLEEYFLNDDINLKLITMNESMESYEVANSLTIEPDKRSTEHFINVSNYLEDIQGFIKIIVNKNITGESIHDINYYYEPVYFNGKDLSSIDEEDSFDLSLLYKNFEVRCLDIPIVDRSSSTEFDKIYEVLDDVEQTVDKMEDRLTGITVFLTKEYEYTFPHSKSSKSNDDYILVSLPFSALKDFEHDLQKPTMIYPIVHTLIYDYENTIFLPFTHNLKYNSFGSTDTIVLNNTKLYLRNVLVKYYAFKLGTMISCINVAGVKINIQNRNITTDISRKFLDEHSKEIVNYALNKVIHLWAYDNLELTATEKRLLEQFIGQFYSKDNILLKKV